MQSVSDKNRTCRGLAAVAAAVAGFGLVRGAQAQSVLTTSSSIDSQVEPSGSAGSSELYLGSYFALNGSGYKYENWGIVQFAAPSLSAGTQVSSVGSNLTLTMDNYSSAYDATSNVTLDFYLTTDTATSVQGSGSPSPETTLQYNSSYTGGFDPHAGDPGTFGQAGIGSPGSQIIPIGTAVYNSTGLAADAPETFNLSLNGAAEQFLQQQINTQGQVTLVVASNETDSNMAAWDGPSDTGHTPSLSFNVTTTTGTSNSSLLYAGSYSAGNTSKSINVPVGKLINGTYYVLAGATTTATVQISNGSTVSGNNLIYSVNNTSFASASSTQPGPDPIAPGGTASITVGFAGTDAVAAAGGEPATGTATVVNQSNFATDTTPVTINLNGGVNSLAVNERFVDSTSGTSTPSVGKVLVGATGTAQVPITTTNPVGLTDYSNDALTTETLNANQTSTPFTQDDIFTKDAVATVSAVSPNTAQTFDSTETGTVTGQVQVLISGVYGNDTPVTEGNVTQNYSSDYTAFPQASITGMGLQGENDSMRVYLQWAGYQAAAVSAGGTVTVAPNSTAQVTLTNAASNDNLYTTGNTTYNNGLRAGAVISGDNGFNQTWTTGGWSLVSGFGVGTTINGSQSTGDPNSYSTNGTVGFTVNTQMITGTYGATLGIVMENEQDIQGATANDLGVIAVHVQATVNNPGVQSGHYTLNGGTLSAPATNLTGSFAQSGGSSVFAGITGTGTVAVSGGSLQLATSSGLSTVNSLSVSGNGSFDITNNHVIINYGTGTDPIASIAAAIKSGYANGSWNGAGIISSAVAANNAVSGNPLYGIGYADAADTGNPAKLASGTIELKYTLLGDADLSGVVDGTDFGIVAANFNKGVSGWDQGDFNYDGTVDGTDFGDLAANFNKGVSGGSGLPAWSDPALLQFAAANGLLADVPEPATAGLVVVGAMGMLAKRRRARSV